ncbi:Hypothetical predicted protein [Octopus vulgaris]|uniref:Uncharacterized protein n=1 Tax=Octopus vulgaris TaxID=6645 RepID=A0AA36BE05_OCTVU|nr:Hypothetical predicted protein [Octopus vulgaris]
MKSFVGSIINIWICLGVILLASSLTSCVSVVTPSDVTEEVDQNETMLFVPSGNETMYEAEDKSKTLVEGNSNTLVVVLLVMGCTFLFAFFLSFVAVLYRYHRRKTAEYQRAAQAHITSTRNAGIYMDLAMDSPMSKSGLPIGAPIYNSLKKHPEQYTFVSDDELDL